MVFKASVLVAATRFLASPMAISSPPFANSFMVSAMKAGNGIGCGPCGPTVFRGPPSSVATYGGINSITFTPGCLQLVAQGDGEGMHGRLGGAVDGEARQGNERQAGGNIDQHSVRLPGQVRNEGGGDANNPQHIGVDLVLQCFLVEWRARSKLQPPLHAGIVEHAVERRELHHNLADDGPDRHGVPYIKHKVAHAGIRRADTPQAILPPATDDDLVPQLVKRLGQTFADSRRAAGNENGVRMHLHELISAKGVSRGPVYARVLRRQRTGPQRGYTYSPLFRYQIWLSRSIRENLVGFRKRRASFWYCRLCEPFGTASNSESPICFDRGSLAGRYFRQARGTMGLSSSY